MLTFEQRKERVFAFFYAKGEGDKAGILRSYTAPEHLSDDRKRDEINNLVEDLNSELPAKLSDADMSFVLSHMRKAIRRRHGARAWPNTKTVLAAMGDALEQFESSKAPKTEEELLSIKVGWVIEYFKKFHRACPWWNTPEITQKLIARGVVESLREARRLGFDLTPEDRRLAMQERMSVAEFDKHVRVLARLRNVSEEEVRAAELKVLSEDQLPKQEGFL